MEYRVNFGYDRRGRPRNKYFSSLNEAKAVVEEVFQRTKVVLSIEAVSLRRKQ
jgi:hypothetical protein